MHRSIENAGAHELGLLKWITSYAGAAHIYIWLGTMGAVSVAEALQWDNGTAGSKKRCIRKTACRPIIGCVVANSYWNRVWRHTRIRACCSCCSVAKYQLYKTTRPGEESRSCLTHETFFVQEVNIEFLDTCNKRFLMTSTPDLIR